MDRLAASVHSQLNAQRAANGPPVLAVREEIAG
jgi:hypothetical protein